MLLTMLKARLHPATVTRCDLCYEGSVPVDKGLLEASGILAHKKVGKIERGKFGISMVGKLIIPFKKGITMWPGDHFDPQPFTARGQQPTGAAIGINDKDFSIIGAVLLNRIGHGIRNSLGPQM